MHGAPAPNRLGSTGSTRSLEKRPVSGATAGTSDPYTLVVFLIAQSNPIADAADVPRLSDPPVLTTYLLESPWPVVAGLIAAGLAALWWMNRAGKVRRGVRVLLAALALAAGVAILASVVTTERETLRGRTAELVKATATADTNGLRDMLTDRVRVMAFGPVPMPDGKQAVLDAVRSYLVDQYPLKEHTIGAVQAIVDGPNTARTQVRAWVKFKDGDLYNSAIGSWWRLTWTRSADGPWRVSGIEVMQIDMVGAKGAQ